MTRRNYKLIRPFVIFLAIIFIFSGCSMLKQRSSKEEGEEKKNPPKALTQMEKDTDFIIKELEAVSEKRARQEREKERPSGEKMAGEQQGQAQQQGQSQEQEQQKQENQEQKQGSNQQQAQQQEQQQVQAQQQPAKTEQPVPQPNWTELEAKIKILHESWNAYEPNAKTDGAMGETMKGFEEQLNSLTEQIIARDEEKTLAAANSLYSYYPDFFKLYAHKQPPEVKEVKGLTRQIILLGQQGKWDETKPLTEKIKFAWQEAKTKMKKPDKALNSRIDFAIADFLSVVSDKNLELAKIKGDILINNLDNVE